MMIELIAEALLTLKANILRTTLTMIGIILGVGAVVAIMTVGKSAYVTVESAINDLGLNRMTIARHYVADGGEMLPLNDSFLSNLNFGHLAGVVSLEPQAGGYSTQAFNQDDDNFRVYVNYAPESDLARHKFISGYPFDQTDIESRSRVVVIDETTARKLYSTPQTAQGQALRLSEDGQFTITGVVADSGLTFGERNMGDVYIPFSLVQLEPYFQTYGYESIAVNTQLGADYDQVAQGIEDYLMDTYGFTDRNDMPFTVRNVQDQMQEISSFMTAFSLGLSLVAAISLVVGGVGIMNIMLVSVTERTKEIGLMKALGAQDQDIIFQFLIESIVMTVFGGWLGVLLGISVSWGLITLANTFGQGYLPTFNFVIEYKAIIVSLIVSVVIGIVFGAYPARQAARLDPVVALRRD